MGSLPGLPGFPGPAVGLGAGWVACPRGPLPPSDVPGLHCHPAGFSGSALGQPSVLGSGCPGREAAAGRRPLTRGTLTGLAVLPSDGRRPAAGFPEMPRTRSPPGRSASCFSPALAACGEGGVGSHPVGSVSAPAQAPLRSQQNSLLNSWVSPPLLPLPPRDYPVGLDPLVRRTVVRVSHPPRTPPPPRV